MKIFYIYFGCPDLPVKNNIILGISPDLDRPFSTMSALSEASTPAQETAPPSIEQPSVPRSISNDSARKSDLNLFHSHLLTYLI